MKNSFGITKFMVPGALLLLGVSCSTLTPYTKDQAYQEALKQSFGEGTSKLNQRVLASSRQQLKTVGFNLEKLRSFQVLSFPKISKIEDKHNNEIFDLSDIKDLTDAKRKAYLDSLQQFGKPITYEFHAVELQSCYKMIKNRPKHNPSKFFGPASLYKPVQEKKCLVLEAKKKPLVKRGNLKNDDVVAVRLYFDEDLKPYGKSVDFHDKSESSKTRTVDYRYNFMTSMSSELSEYPVDFPNFIMDKIVKNWKKVSKNSLNIPDQKYVKSKISKLVKTKRCQSGYQTSYDDIYGNPVRIGWCKGHSWPTTVHTNRFFSIVKRIK